MAKATSWSAQTKWLSDQRYYSPKIHVTGSIWTDRVTKSDRRCEVTDRDLAKRKQPDQRLQAVAMVDVVMRRLGAKAGAITPRTKWLAVDLLMQRRGAEAMAVLTA